MLVLSYVCACNIRHTNQKVLPLNKTPPLNLTDTRHREASLNIDRALQVEHCSHQRVQDTTVKGHMRGVTCGVDRLTCQRTEPIKSWTSLQKLISVLRDRLREEEAQDVCECLMGE